jgi:hypothetical protein
VVVSDCSTDPTKSCGPDPVNGGYDCVLTANHCGSTPITGVCQGNMASYCNSGTVQTTDCGSACISFPYVYQGTSYTYNYCNPCGAGQVPAADGLPNTDGSVRCVAATGATTGSTGTSGTTGSGGGTKSGCGSTNDGASVVLILGMVGLALSRRKN